MTRCPGTKSKSSRSAFDNGTAHDVFQRPLAVRQRNGAHDIIPNFDEWKAGFPGGVFVEGITGFNGKTYSFPATSNKRYGTHLLYNVDYRSRGRSTSRSNVGG